MILPEGYHARPATVEDAPGAARVIAACESASGQDAIMTADVVRHFWQTVDLASQTIVITKPAGEIAATADIDNQGYVSVSVFGHVHPACRGQGLGSFLVDWGERWVRAHIEQAPPDARVVVQHLIPSTDDAARALLGDLGYEPARTTYFMRIELDAEPPEPAWPKGIGPSPYRPDVDEPEIHAAVEDAFRDVWGRPASSFERFLANRPSRRAQADLWLVARSGGEIAGVSIGKLLDKTGVIDNVGVRRRWRGQGLGLALMHASFWAFYRRGITDVRLNVDAESLTGATRLYERAGMHVASKHALYEKVLRDGAGSSR